MIVFLLFHKFAKGRQKEIYDQRNLLFSLNN